MYLYGVLMHSFVELRSSRKQYHGTFFLRNRPELELIRVLASQKGKGSTLRIAVLACSNGAEVYSILWAIRSARPDLAVIVQAVDISAKILEVAKHGVYSLEGCEQMGSSIFERLTDEEIRTMFEREGDQVRIKPWIKEGITWQVADAADTKIPKLLGTHDIVLANRFLCHMDPSDAEMCLRNLATLVNPGGYLFVSGIDLDIRTKVAFDLAWSPVQDLLEEMHEGDPSVRKDWPWKYWGLEPFTRKRKDWSVRYASVFRVGVDGQVAK
jgi:SAM-dependent methyltransferase